MSTSSDVAADPEGVKGEMAKDDKKSRPLCVFFSCSTTTSASIISFRFFDSDIDNTDDGLDSDVISAHSFKTRTPTKTSKKDAAKLKEPVYLDSLPEITDSGIKRNKDIQNNPLTLDEDAIDPLLREDHKTLPILR